MIREQVPVFMNKCNVKLTQWQTRILLEGLRELEKNWLQINRSTTDEDERAEYANDLIELNMTRKHLESSVGAGLGEALPAPEETHV